MSVIDDHGPRRKVGPWMKLMIYIAGADEETLQHCPQHDWSCVCAAGEIFLCALVFQTAILTLVAHELFAKPGEFRVELLIGALFIALFVMLIDSYMVMRSGWHLSGIQELKRGGLDVSGGAAARIKAHIFLAVRLGFSVALAQLTAIFVSLLIFFADIEAPILDDYLKANAHLVAPATELVNATIARATSAVSNQTARVQALAGQVATTRQNIVDPSSSDPVLRQAEKEVGDLTDRNTKAEDEARSGQVFVNNESGGVKGDGNSGIPGYGPRYRSAVRQAADAKSHAQSIAVELATARSRLDDLQKQHPIAADAVRQQAHDQLPSLEESLKAEESKLGAGKNELATLIANREENIRKAIENSPDHVAMNNGFLHRIAILEDIATKDRKIAAVIILIDLISFALELAGVFSKVTSFIPTMYAALTARNAYMGAVHIVDEMTAELKAIDAESEKIGIQPDPDPPLEPAPAAAPPLVPEPTLDIDKPPEPAKRPRGRPRKHPRPNNGASGASNILHLPTRKNADESDESNKG
ncbi:MAG TPA: DUF4407 domain-containing protein [Xanthobacteraceae bacterium]|jgi:hypothetical protein|nr:DUF4407 domain-containing protein [Xanthobacteraceae bacterium]